MSNRPVDTLSDSTLEKLWYEYDWQAAESELLSMQQMIVKAAFKNDWAKMQKLTSNLVNSKCAGMLAVRKVCEADPPKGIDGIKWTNGKERYLAAMSLNVNYHAKPYRRIIIKTKTGKERNIHIPTYTDRAMQTLYKFALEPIAEGLGDRKSFGFRKGRSAQDANEYVKDALIQIGTDGYVVVSDVKACYESISQKWLLANIPIDKAILREFLSAGYIFAGDFFPTEEIGIATGASLSPILGNMTLDGLQSHIYSRLYGTGERDYPNGNMIRFADDILVTVRTEDEGKKVLSYIADFLHIRGLELSENKTHILRISDGFDYLARNYQMNNGIVIVKPSESSIARIEDDLKRTILNHTGSQKSLIDALNRKLKGWASYHRIAEADVAFREVDTFVKAHLLQLCKTKFPKLSMEKILSKYWYLDYDGQYVYALPDIPEIRVIRLSDVKLTKHHKVSLNANPYLDIEYYDKRNQVRDIFNINGKYKSIWDRQGGLCYHCGKPILKDQKKVIIQVDLSKSTSVRNSAYIHAKCRDYEAEIIKTQYAPRNEHELYSTIKNLTDTVHRRQYKFAKLSDYFHSNTAQRIVLTFSEIEKIMGKPLCNMARQTIKYWHRDGNGVIRTAWASNGYKLYSVDIKKEKAVFILNDKRNAPIQIPDVLLSGSLPDDAKWELENFISHLMKKYGL